MLIKSININNLRNIKQAEIKPGPGLNVFYGDNGAGKTSILESLIILAKGRSFRSGNTGALIGPEGDSFRVVAALEDQEQNLHKVGLERSGNDWKARIDGSDARQLSDLASLMPLVLLEPNSHLLVSGAPEGRRKPLAEKPRSSRPAADQSRDFSDGC